MYVCVRVRVVHRGRLGRIRNPPTYLLVGCEGEREREREKTSSTLGTGGARRVGVVCVWFVGEYNIYSFSEFIEMSRS